MIEPAEGPPPDRLEVTPKDESTRRTTARQCLSSKVCEAEFIPAGRDQSTAPYRENDELWCTLSAAGIKHAELRDTSRRGGPGGSFFVTVYGGDPFKLNTALEKARLPYRVEEQPFDQSATIGG